MKKLTIWPNGNVSAWDGDESIDEINATTWIHVYLAFLELKGYNPAEFIIYAPKAMNPTRIFVPFKTSEGWWNIYIEENEEAANKRREELKNK